MCGTQSRCYHKRLLSMYLNFFEQCHGCFFFISLVAMSILHEFFLSLLTARQGSPGKISPLAVASVELYPCIAVGVSGFDCSSVGLIGHPSDHDHLLSDVYLIGILSSKKGISCGLTLPQGGYEGSVVELHICLWDRNLIPFGQCLSKINLVMKVPPCPCQCHL